MKALRLIPSVDKVLAAAEIKDACQGLPRPAVVAAIRAVLDRERGRLIAGERAGDAAVAMEELAPLIAQTARSYLKPLIEKVINATGIIIHTNLGRAPLAPAAVDAIVNIAGGYSNLEYNLAAGARGGRTAAAEGLLVELTGAESALAVNNNAAALLLVLAALAKGREAIVSRGELIEIGGSFRLPEVMAAAGCVTREVGTTNKTHIKDYEQAIGKKTALIMKVHTSNYQVVGFSSAVTLAELAALGRARKKTVVEDLGSGNLVALPGPDEPTVRRSVEAGADLITFSGDKLLGGPQCGLIVGSAGLISKLRGHPVYRAVRLDKLNLAALEATLRLYRYDEALRQVPVAALLAQSPATLEARAEKLIDLIEGSARVAAVKTPTTARVGGGAWPGGELPSFGLRLSSAAVGADGLAARLRRGDPPVVGRIEEGGVILDMIAVFDHDIEGLARAIIDVDDG